MPEQACQNELMVRDRESDSRSEIPRGLGSLWTGNRSDCFQPAPILLPSKFTSSGRPDGGRRARCHGRGRERHSQDSDNRPIYEPSKRRLTWPNGAIATTYSADEPERLRGPQHDCAWCDELGTWPYPKAWDMLMFRAAPGRGSARHGHHDPAADLAHAACAFAADGAERSMPRPSDDRRSQMGTSA